MLALGFFQLAFSVGIRGPRHHPAIRSVVERLSRVGVSTNKNSKSQEKIIRFSPIFYGDVSDSEMTPCS